MAKEVIYELGLQEVWVQTWDDIAGEYTGDVIALAGDHKITYKKSTSATQLPSGDDPAWAVVEGSSRYEGTLSIYSLSADMKDKLFAVIKSASNGLMLGDTNAAPKYVGLMADNRVVENNENSVNRVMFYKVHFDEPETTSETNTEDGATTADLEIDFQAYPVPYQMSDGTYASRVGREVNSKLNPDAFKALETQFTAPSEADIADAE